MKALATAAAISPWGVYSVWRRHADVYRITWPSNLLPPMSEPILYLFAFGAGLGPMIGAFEYQGSTLTYAQFLGPGMIAVAVLFQSFFEGAYASFIRLSFQKTWQALLTAPLSYTDVFLGDWLWATTKGVIGGSATGLVVVLLGLYPPVGLLYALPVMVLGGMLFGACGLVTAGTVRIIDQVNLPTFLFIIPMFALSGTYFPRTNLPGVSRYFAEILPLAPVVDFLRWPYGLPSYWPWQLAGLIVLIAVAGSWAWWAIRRRIYL
ncbi:ABC transporter permease [Gloeobacter morelensis]|uniref:Transport permease protein n=1 Tax=Gloeobacter morelensis MG652769 TaxID=2781736 RepID=A0ABY3PIW5_9CYAN|nr:ABC transporter permease [Gloeobacter morelensis]UFP93610.1 ABC transporter permease [Gloeobacter morelensis MG652769]